MPRLIWSERIMKNPYIFTKKELPFGWAARGFLVLFSYRPELLFSPGSNLQRDPSNRKSALNKDENQNKG